MKYEESTTNGGVYSKIRYLLRRCGIFVNSQKSRLIKRLSLPNEFLRDLEDFEERNSLVVEPNAAHVHHKGVCCSRCLKAYALAKAREMRFACDKIAPLFVLMNCEAGHNGYYEDSGQLVEVS